MKKSLKDKMEYHDKEKEGKGEGQIFIIDNTLQKH